MFEDLLQCSDLREEKDLSLVVVLDLKGYLKSLAKKQGMDKPSDVLKKGNPKSQVPKESKTFCV